MQAGGHRFDSDILHDKKIRKRVKGPMARFDSEISAMMKFCASGLESKKFIDKAGEKRREAKAKDKQVRKRNCDWNP